MGIPQIIYLLLLFAGLGVSLARHGSPREVKENFYYSLVGVCIQIGLLWWGGYFQP